MVDFFEKAPLPAVEIMFDLLTVAVKNRRAEENPLGVKPKRGRPAKAVEVTDAKI
jgi:hypothetical protein